MTEPILSVRGLTTVLHLAGGPVDVVRDVSFDILPGETLALVGESGCGKSMTMLSVMGLHPQPPAEIVAGRVEFEAVDLLQVSEERRRLVRGAELAMVYQDPMTSLNPLMRVGDQISEVLIAHGRSQREAKQRTLEVLGQVGIPRPARAAEAFPHEFSGGMRQRVVIAIALALRPKLLIADEPTTALDVTIQQQIIELVRDLQADTGMAVVWITHDLGVVARVAGRILVMYAGHIVESGSTAGVFHGPEHPYTAGLLASIPPIRGKERPDLVQIPGTPPDPAHQPPGCPFHPRCPQAIDRCSAEMPPRTEREAGPADPSGETQTAACWVPPEEWVA
ncbi:MAG TPA: ABC transporter ATP-binding protein [Acidimicrobiia bacterium]|jgi:oligopeptide/dipeptide ABC transporter ATP-binding protein|nr:ABC transporter ATP-binding protein [Acidimicrobiia bacterium]